MGLALMTSAFRCDSALTREPAAFYLMEPPSLAETVPLADPDEVFLRLPDSAAPFSRWKQIASFDTAAACEAARNANLTVSGPVWERYRKSSARLWRESKSRKLLRPTSNEAKALTREYSLCMASSDVRLVEPDSVTSTTNQDPEIYKYKFPSDFNGWYQMRAPATADGSVLWGAPLIMWKIAGFWRTRESCQTAIEQEKRIVHPAPRSEEEQAMFMSFYWSSVCIASNDPRLTAYR